MVRFGQAPHAITAQGIDEAAIHRQNIGRGIQLALPHNITAGCQARQGGMMDTIDSIFLAMAEYFSGDAKRIQHFTKVHAYSRLLGRQEGLDEKTQFILEAAALIHDIGIKKAEALYGSCSGHLQELEGPAEAEKLLKNLCLPAHAAERICYLVGHHHTYAHIEGADYQLLVEADFLVNLHEDGAGKSAVCHALERIFRSKSGIALCHKPCLA